jgi:uncharacterized protein (TIGR02246 family)
MALDGVQQLLDLEAIKQLKARYFRSIDHQDWDSFRDVFAEQAVLELPEIDNVVRGRDEIVALVSSSLKGAQTVHHGHMPEIEVSGPETARGTWAMSDYVEWPSRDGARVGLRGYGHYIEEYVKEADGRWRIIRSRLARLRVDPLGSKLPY